MRLAPPPMLGSCGFCGFCPAAVVRTLCFRRVCPVNLVGSWVSPSCFFGGCPFALARGFHAFFVWSRSCRSYLPVVKTKISLFLQLFAIRGSFFNLVKRKRPLSGGLPAALYLDLRSEGSQQLPIAKKLQFESNFCFQFPVDGFLAVPWAG